MRYSQRSVSWDEIKPVEGGLRKVIGLFRVDLETDLSRGIHDTNETDIRATNGRSSRTSHGIWRETF